MRELLDGRLAPITYEIGFLECSRDLAVTAYLQWMRGIYEKLGRSMIERRTTGRLEDVLRQLLPLTSVDKRRFLFIPTSSPWTAFFDNGHRGTDAFPPMSYLAEVIGCRSLRVGYVPDEASGSYPARILSIYGPDVKDGTNTIRTVAAGADGPKWSFETYGPFQPFEQLQFYAKGRIQDRFPAEVLERYLRQLGVRAFEEDFYLSDSAVLVEKVGPITPRAKEFGLDNDLPPAP